MTAQPIAPVIPPAGRPGRLRTGKPHVVYPLPLASPLSQPDAVYGFGRVDASGRVADRVILAALGWRGGDRLTLTADAGVMVARRDRDGIITVPDRARIVMPATVRRRCGLLPGDRVLLAAWPAEDTLAAYSLAVVEKAIRAHSPLPRGEGGRP